MVDTNCDPDIIDYVIPGNDDAIRSAQLMCRVISDAVIEGREIARRRGARPGTRSEDAAPAPAPPKPQRTPEEQAEFDRRQAEARDAAAAKQREIEERARLGKDAAKSAPADGDATVGEATTPEAAGAETAVADEAAGDTAADESGEG